MPSYRTDTDLQEEKAKHQELYPEYRYQPRRFGRSANNPLNSSGGPTTAEKYRCPKCGGRSIKTPTSPFMSASGAPTLPPPISTENITPTTRYSPMMNNLSLESPGFRRDRMGSTQLANIQVPSTQVDTPMATPVTPDSKKRRYNHYAAPSTAMPTGVRRVETAPMYYGRRESLPPIGTIRTSPPMSAAMPPPPRTPRKPSTELHLAAVHTGEQPKTVEAAMMNVPYSVKVKVLGRITPPLKDSSQHRVRGAVLAIEGDDSAAIEDLTAWLDDLLKKDGAYRPRIAAPPRVPAPDTKGVTFEQYLDLIKEWHNKSHEMADFVTTPLTPPPADASWAKSLTGGSTEPSQAGVVKPVVLLPTYQLHAANAFTACIPIADQYSPTDHWQWMATLWRGTVGPDLTIYVQSVEREQLNGKLVELNEEYRLMTVRKQKGAKFDDGALRRVGFEVGEWIRGVGSKAGR